MDGGTPKIFSLDRMGPHPHDENTVKMTDPVNHPEHYTSHPSGIECIQITEHMNFCLGNAVKYLWRSGLKDGSPEVQDLKKAIWYINRELVRLGYHPDTPDNLSLRKGIAQALLKTGEVIVTEGRDAALEFLMGKLDEIACPKK